MGIPRNCLRSIKALTGALVMVMLLPATAVATEETTTDPWWLTRSGKTVEGAFAVANSAGHHEVGEGRLQVKVLKRKNGTWKLVVKKGFVSRQEGAALWSFPVKLSGVPTRGSCKVIAHYKGSEQYAPSKTAVKTKCGAKEWYAQS